MVGVCKSFVNMEIGASYFLYFPFATPSNGKIYLLVAEFECTERYHDLYMFIDSYGTKVTFTRSSFQILQAKKYVPPPKFIPDFEEDGEAVYLQMQPNLPIQWEYFKK
jgi:hypothetical protein